MTRKTASKILGLVAATLLLASAGLCATGLVPWTMAQRLLHEEEGAGVAIYDPALGGDPMVIQAERFLMGRLIVASVLFVPAVVAIFGAARLGRSPRSE